jgi:hypothetical protein
VKIHLCEVDINGRLYLARPYYGNPISRVKNASSIMVLPEEYEGPHI